MTTKTQQAAAVFDALARQFLNQPAWPKGQDPTPFRVIAVRQMLTDAIAYGRRAIIAGEEEQADAWREIAEDMAIAVRIAGQAAPRGFMDPTTRELVESLCYDVSQLPYAFMRDNPAARSAYNSWDKLTARLAEVGR